MAQKLIIFVIAAVLIVTAALAFSLQINPSAAQTSAQIKAPEAPDHVVYRHLFRHVAVFKERADELERQGVAAASAYRGFFKRKANLSDDEAQKLEQIALQVAQEIRAIDERAKPIIQAYRARYPNGQVLSGQSLAPPPAELQQLTRERNELVLRKRDDLRTAFGEEAFGRFHGFVKNKIASGVNLAIPAEQ